MLKVYHIHFCEFLTPMCIYIIKMYYCSGINLYATLTLKLICKILLIISILYHLFTIILLNFNRIVNIIL